MSLVPPPGMDGSAGQKGERLVLTIPKVVQNTSISIHMVITRELVATVSEKKVPGTRGAIQQKI